MIMGIETPENATGIVDVKSGHRSSGNKFMLLNEEPLTVNGSNIPFNTRLSLKPQGYEDSGSKIMRLNEEPLRIDDDEASVNLRLLNTPKSQRYSKMRYMRLSEEPLKILSVEN